MGLFDSLGRSVWPNTCGVAVRHPAIPTCLVHVSILKEPGIERALIVASHRPRDISVSRLVPDLASIEVDRHANSRPALFGGVAVRDHCSSTTRRNRRSEARRIFAGLAAP